MPLLHLGDGGLLGGDGHHVVAVAGVAVGHGAGRAPVVALVGEGGDGALADDVALELGDARDRAEHQAADRGADVDRVAAEVDQVEANAGPVPSVDRGHRVYQVAEQAVQFEGDDVGDGARSDHAEQACAARSLGQRLGCRHALFADHGDDGQTAHRTVRTQPFLLRVQTHAGTRLLVSAHADVEYGGTTRSSVRCGVPACHRVPLYRLYIVGELYPDYAPL